MATKDIKTGGALGVMDYKHVCAVLNWHGLNTKLNGTECRVLMVMATSADYRSGTYRGSMGELATALGTTRAVVAIAIAELIRAGALHQAAKGLGSAASTYRVLTATELEAAKAAPVATTEDNAALVAGTQPIVAPPPSEEDSYLAASRAEETYAATRHKAPKAVNAELARLSYEAYQFFFDDTESLYAPQNREALSISTEELARRRRHVASTAKALAEELHAAELAGLL